jgi:MFS family permease
VPALKGSGLGRTARQYILAMGLINLAFFVFQGYFVFYLQQSGLSYLQMSLIYSVNLIFCALLSLPMGNLADRYGRKKAFAAGTAIMGMAMFIYAFSSAFSIFILAEIIWAVGWALMNGSNEAWVIDQLAKEGRSSDVPRTFTLMMGASYFVGVVGGLVASMLVVFALNLPFLGAALITFLTAALVMRNLSENYGTQRSSLRQILGESLAFYRSSKGLQLLTAAESFRYITAVIYLFLYQPYLVAIGLGEDYLGVYFSVLMISSAAGSMLAPRLNERVGHHWVLALSSIGLVSSFLLLSLTPGLAISCALFALCGLSNGMGWPPLMIWRNRIVPSHIRASALALFSSFTYLAGAVMTLALGALLDASNPTAGFVFAALIGVSSIPLFLVANRKTMAEEPIASPAPTEEVVQQI